MKWANKILILAVGLLLIFIVWHSRQIFFGRYEPEYLENLYYHSQWNIPMSPRGISDGLLYQFVGYRLVQGENPFNLNYEVPPLGKYLYGLSEWWLGNPYWVSLGLYLASLLVFYAFAKEILREKSLSRWALLLFVSTPMVATQVKDTMLDLPLMFFYLVHAWVFCRYIARGGIKNLIVAGIFLGLATGTKFGAYTPPVLLAGLAVMLFTKKPIREFLVYLGTTAFGYVLAYFAYFSHHPNPIPWLRLHQKQIEFYLSPNNTVDHWNQWRGIFLNVYQGWWGAGQTALGDWSPLLPLGVIALLAVLIWGLRTRAYIWVYLALLGGSFLLVNTVIAFWPRYLIPLVPILILALSQIFRHLRLVLLVLVLANLPFLYRAFAVRDYQGPADAVARFVSTRAYRELYRSLPESQREEIPEEEFSQNLETFWDGLETHSVVMKINQVIPNEKGMNVKAVIESQTRYGLLTREVDLKFQLENNHLRLIWDWDYLWPGFVPGAKIDVTNLRHIALKEIRDEKGFLKGVRGPGYAVYAQTRVLSIPRDTDLLAGVIVRDNQSALEQVQSAVPDKYHRFVGYLDPTFGDGGKTRALAIPSVTLREIEFVINVPSVDLLSRAIKTRPELFYQQADVYLVKNNTRILLPFKRSPETDVVLKF